MISPRDRANALGVLPPPRHGFGLAVFFDLPFVRARMVI